jgi:3-dehydroquinate dehydratase II
MARIVYVLNGPNLNLLGQRQPEIYGRESLADIAAACEAVAERLGLTIRFHQSNAEHALIDWIHDARTTAAGIVINPAAYTHTSVAIRDALAACDIPVIEVHLSNVHARETFRRHSYVSPVAKAVIAGCGAQGYDFALMRLARLLDA